MPENATLFDEMSKKRFTDTKTRIKDFSKLVSEKTGALSGIKTGFSELDERIDGLQPGIMLVGGRSHHGKTIFFINMKLGVASVPTNKVLSFSIDDSASKIVNRLIAHESSEPINDIGYPRRVLERRGQDGFERFLSNMENGINSLIDKSDNLQIVDASDMVNYSQIVEEIQLSHQELKEGEQLVVFIDNFHKIRNDCFNRNEQYIKMSEGLKKLSVDLKIPIIMTVEFKKTGEYGRPSIDDIKDAVDLQYDADVIALIHNDHQAKHGKTDVVYRTGMPGSEKLNPVIEVHLCKNKQGSSHGFLYYAFYGWKSQVVELEPKTYEGYTMLINGKNKTN